MAKWPKRQIAAFIFTIVILGGMAVIFWLVTDSVVQVAAVCALALAIAVVSTLLVGLARRVRRCRPGFRMTTRLAGPA